MKRNIFLYAVLSLFTVTTATGCDERSDNPMPDSAIRVETAEVTAITSENAISDGRIIGETQAVKEFGICWATTDNPTVSDNHNVRGRGCKFICLLCNRAFGKYDLFCPGLCHDFRRNGLRSVPPIYDACRFG